MKKTRQLQIEAQCTTLPPKDGTAVRWFDSPMVTALNLFYYRTIVPSNYRTVFTIELSNHRTIELMKAFYSKIKLDDIGAIWVALTPRGICRISFDRGKSDFLNSLPMGMDWIEDSRPFAGLKKKLGRFMQGGAPLSDIALDLCGTKFQRAVWEKISEIPRGETRSYAWLARAAGKPRGHRVAANACGANPVPIIIPCHRVISSDGTIGGFSSGIRIKKRLLIADRKDYKI